MVILIMEKQTGVRYWTIIQIHRDDTNTIIYFSYYFTGEKCFIKKINPVLNYLWKHCRDHFIPFIFMHEFCFSLLANRSYTHSYSPARKYNESRRKFPLLGNISILSGQLCWKYNAWHRQFSKEKMFVREAKYHKNYCFKFCTCNNCMTLKALSI